MPRSKQANPSRNEFRVYQFIIEHKMNSDGNSPTRREIAEATGIKSTSVVEYYLKNLQRLGKIELGDTYKRNAIRVTGGKWTLSKGAQS